MGLFYQSDVQLGDADADPAPTRLVRRMDGGGTGTERDEHRVSGIGRGAKESKLKSTGSIIAARHLVDFGKLDLHERNIAGLYKAGTGRKRLSVRIDCDAQYRAVA